MLHCNYAHIAPTYDEIRFSGNHGGFNARADAAIVRELVGLAGPATVYDVPVGTGRVAEYLCNSGVDIVGGDLTREMLARAAERASHTNCAPLELVQCDASDLPWASDSIECLISLRFFHLIPHEARPAFASEFSRVIRPGGHLICSFTNGWYGGGVNWIHKALGRNSLFFLKRGELRRLFPDFRIRAIRGNFWPLQRLTEMFGARAAGLSLGLNRHFPLNRICWEAFYLLEKSPE